MAIPDYQTLMLPLLRLAAEGEQSVPKVAGPIADHFALTEPEREELLSSGRQRVLHNRIHWAKFYMSKAGLLESPARGSFEATATGQQLLAENPARVDVQLLKTFPKFVSFYQSDGSGSATESPISSDPALATLTPEEQIELAYHSLETALRSALLERIQENSPAFFEQLVVDLLVAMGYGGTHVSASEQLGRSGDGGVDGVINEDRLGVDRIYVQAKRYAEGSTIGRPDIQGFVGSLVGLGATKGVFVTTCRFSQQAVEFVRHLSQRIVLIDGNKLAALMIEHGVGV